MQYAELSAYAGCAYPNMDIPMKEKGDDFCMAYAKAAYYDFNAAFPKGVFYSNNGSYEKNRLYALGKQPVTQYQNLLGVDSQTNESWMNIDWTVRPIVSKYRDIAINRMIQGEYDCVATPIDATAKSYLDDMYAKAQAKIAVRQMMMQQDPSLANHPMVAAQPGEPQDMEELQMRVAFGEQFNRSKDAELAIQLGLYNNDHKVVRRWWFEDLFDYGVAGYFEWLGADNRPKFRRVDPASVVSSYCRRSDFKDMVHCGEVIDVALVDLATMTDEDGNAKFSEQDLQNMASMTAGKWGNPIGLGASTGLYLRAYDKFKVKVLQIYFYSYDDLYYNEWKNDQGNPRWEMKDRPASRSGKTKYKSKRIKNVYKASWIIGTDFCYECGRVTNQKRSVNTESMAETTLPYKFFAPNFYEMRVQSCMDRLIPFADDYQLTAYRLQNFKAQMVPSGWWIDLDGLENVALTKGGAEMKPMELLEMFRQRGILVGRSKDLMGDMQNYKPIIPISNTATEELAVLYNDLQFSISQMQSIVGLNDITDGSTPNAKNLNSTNEYANISTNNALFGLTFAEKQLYTELAHDIIVRTQQGLRFGGVEGYAPALNTNILTFMSVSPTVALHDYGIMLEEKTTEEQKAIIMQMMSGDIANGYLDTGDALYIMTIYNAKQAIQVLTYKVRQAKQMQQQAELAKINANAQQQVQAAAAAHQFKMTELQTEWQLKERYMLLEKQLAGQLTFAELQSKERISGVQAQSKIASTAIQAQAKQEQSTTP